MQEFLVSLYNFFLQFLPFRVVQENHWGIRWSLGKLTKIVQGRVIWGIPIIQPLEVFDATLAALFPPVQGLSTEDQQPIAVRIGLEWRIQDIKKFILSIGDNDFNDIIAIITQSSVANIIVKTPLSEIITKQKTVETKITNQISDATAEYGILVKRAHIVECVPVFPIKVFTNETKTV